MTAACQLADHLSVLLYGVVLLSNLVDKFKTDIYEGNAYAYIEDGDSGDFILDTWQKSLGNIRDFSKSKIIIWL